MAIKSPGYCYKLCPYSLAYKNQYYLLGFDGNSNNPNLPIPDAQITEHTTTSGTMNYHHKGRKPGWICKDDSCYFFTTFGRYYFET